ncbi:hypothetical protein L208DRAFT_120805 [Tricholoma matsutake]|nr:hypothetical protein L208DRAFT_120805 [Tricholoma matsutake 945]
MPKASQTSQQGFFKLQSSLEPTPSILFDNTGPGFSNTHNDFQQLRKPRGNASIVERAWEQQLTCFQTPSNSRTRKRRKSTVHFETDIMQTSLAEKSLPTPKTPSNFLVGDLWNLSGQSSGDFVAVGSNPVPVTPTSSRRNLWHEHLPIGEPSEDPFAFSDSSMDSRAFANHDLMPNISAATHPALLSPLRFDTDIHALDYDLNVTLKHDKKNAEQPKILSNSQSANSAPPVENIKAKAMRSILATPRNARISPTEFLTHVLEDSECISFRTSFYSDHNVPHFNKLLDTIWMADKGYTAMKNWWTHAVDLVCNMVYEEFESAKRSACLQMMSCQSLSPIGISIRLWNQLELKSRPSGVASSKLPPRPRKPRKSTRN